MVDLGNNYRLECIYACTTFGLFVFFPGVFLSSRVTGACPVTTDLIMRVNVRTTTTTTTIIYEYICFGTTNSSPKSWSDCESECLCTDTCCAGCRRVKHYDFNVKNTHTVHPNPGPRCVHDIPVSCRTWHFFCQGWHRQELENGHADYETLFGSTRALRGQSTWNF